MNSNKSLFVVGIFFLISLGNILTLGSISNLAIAAAEYCVVFFLIFSNKIPLALFLHHAFIITSISATNVAGIIDNPMALYSYSRLKLIGPIGVSYLVSILICILSLKNYPKIDKSTLFYKLFKTISILGASGIIVGLCGFILDSYYTFDTFVFYSVYIFVIWLNILCLLLNHSDKLVNLYYNNAIPIIIGGIFASFVAYYFFGVVNVYGNLEIILQADIVYYAPVIIIGLYFVKKRLIPIAAVLLYLYISSQSIGGKGLVITALSIVFLVYTSLFPKGKTLTTKQKIRNQIIVTATIIIGVAFVLTLDFGILFSSKMHQLTSMFSGDLDSIDESPYTRVATTLNILDNYLHRPWCFIFGMGYGGYFTDSLSLFGGLDLTSGGWSDEVVKSGHFNMGHDTFASVPLFNGFFGLYLIFKIVFLYAKRIRSNMYAFAAIPWLFLTFYFNTQLAISGLLLLYASEYEINKK